MKSVWCDGSGTPLLLHYSPLTNVPYYSYFLRDPSERGPCVSYISTLPYPDPRTDSDMQQLLLSLSFSS